MDFKQKISRMKCATLDQASRMAVKVKNQKGDLIGKLLPVGEWILDDAEKIEAISLWRQKAMRMFLTQFESTFERTYNYLSNLSIKQEGRLFFCFTTRAIGLLGIWGFLGLMGVLENWTT